MRSIFPAVLLLSAAFLIAGCSGGAANSNAANANANAEKPSEFDAITDPAVAVAEGDRLLDDNQTEKAIEAYRRAVKLNPDLADAHFKLGIAYALIEAEQEKAGQEIVTVGSSDGKKGKFRSQAAFEKAVEAYKKLLAANPKDDAAQFNLGRSYNKLNKDEEAEEAFKQAVKLKPDDTEYQTEYGSILIKLAKYREALTPLKKAMELDPENSRAENLLEDAEAGAKRVEFVQKDKDANANKMDANANIAGSGNGNTSAGPANTTTKSEKEVPKAKKPDGAANKPR